MAISVSVDTSNLNRRLLEFSIVAKKDFGEILRKEAGIITGLLIEQSPPGDGRGTKGTSTIARRMGEAHLESDIRKIFPTSKAPKGALEKWAAEKRRLRVSENSQPVTVHEVALDLAALRRLHQASRLRKSGRTYVRGNTNIAVTRARLLNQYIREAKKQVGSLSAGFLPAARKFGTSKRSQPAWIVRHAAGAKGAGTERTGANGIILRIENTEGYHDPAIVSRMRYVVRRRERGLAKAIDAMLQRRARRRR